MGGQSLGAVPRISEDRKTVIVTMDAHLVCAPGKQSHFEERGTLETLLDDETTNRRFATRDLGAEAATIPGAATVQSPPLSLGGRVPCDKHLVTAINRMFVKLVCQRSVRGVALGDDHQPGGVFVQSMHNAGAQGIATPSRTTEEDSVDQRPVRMTRCGMNHQTLRFVHHNDPIVLESYVERHLFRTSRERLRRRDSQNYLLPDAQFLSGTRARVIYSGQVRIDELLDLRASNPRVLVAEKVIETHSLIFGIDNPVPHFEKFFFSGQCLWQSGGLPELTLDVTF